MWSVLCCFYQGSQTATNSKLTIFVTMDNDARYNCKKFKEKNRVSAHCQKGFISVIIKSMPLWPLSPPLIQSRLRNKNSWYRSKPTHSILKHILRTSMRNNFFKFFSSFLLSIIGFIRLVPFRKNLEYNFIFKKLFEYWLL